MKKIIVLIIAAIMIAIGLISCADTACVVETRYTPEYYYYNSAPYSRVIISPIPRHRYVVPRHHRPHVEYRHYPHQHNPRVVVPPARPNTNNHGNFGGGRR